MAPVRTIDSPSAMMTKSWKRSAKCAVCTFQAADATGLRPGTRNTTSGAP